MRRAAIIPVGSALWLALAGCARVRSSVPLPEAAEIRALWVVRSTLAEYARSNRDHVEGLYTSPAAPEVKEHIYSVWIDLVERYEL